MKSGELDLTAPPLKKAHNERLVRVMFYIAPLITFTAFRYLFYLRLMSNSLPLFIDEAINPLSTSYFIQRCLDCTSKWMLLEKWVLVVLVVCSSIGSFSQGSLTHHSDIEERCLAHLTVSEQYINNDLDSALVHATAALALIKDVDSDDLTTKVLLNLGDVNGLIGDMDVSLDYYLQGKVRNDRAREKNPQEWELIVKQSDIAMKIGTLYFRLHDYGKSLLHFEESMKLLESVYINIPELDIANRKVKIYNNIAGVYIQQSDFSTALTYFQNAIEINKLPGNKSHESSLSNNIGICYLEKGDHDLANHYFLKAFALRTELADKRGQAQVLNNLGKNQARQGNFKVALDFYLQALTLGREIGNGESILLTLESLSVVYDTLGHYESALRVYQESKSLGDSIFSLNSKMTIAQLEDTYKRDQEKKVAGFEAEKIEAERRRIEIRNIAIGGALFFLLLTAFLLIVLLRGRIKNGQLQQSKLKLEQENLELEHRTLQENLAFKDRELTANALFLLKNNELISKITENLLKAKSTFRQENQQIIQDIIHELQSSQDKRNWQEFEAHFTHVHANFYRSLQEQFPGLTPNEKKLCAFLRLNMSTKDISAITYQTINSITVARSRLRKKLNIEGEDIHLVNFLMQI